MNKDISNAFLDKIKKDMRSLLEKKDILCENTSQGILELSDHGWYLAYDTMPLTALELGEKLKKGCLKEVDDILIQYHEETLNLVEKRVVSLNPNRESIIKEAFDNHRNKKYNSSIVLLLTQVDGLCYDKYQKYFFTNNTKLSRKNIYKPQVEEKISEREKRILNGFEIPLQQSTGINEHTSNLSKFPIRLNRHDILHGMDYNYGTKINSLKIISLLNYINDIVVRE